MGRTEKILDRIDELYKGFVQKQLECSKQELISKAEDIAFVNKIADLLHDDAEELPECLVAHLHKEDTLFSELLGMWKNAEPNRREDENETLRGLFMRRNSELTELYSVEEVDDELEM